MLYANEIVVLSLEPTNPVSTRVGLARIVHGTFMYLIYTQYMTQYITCVLMEPGTTEYRKGCNNFVSKCPRYIIQLALM
jgi:hypothetical protein